MNPKNTWLLVVLTAGLFAFIYFFERHIQPPPPTVVKVLPDLKAPDVTSIEIDPRGQFAIRVERTNGIWQLTRPVAYPVRGPLVDALLAALENLSPQPRITAQELEGSKKMSEDFGFDNPLITIQIQQGDDLKQLKLGNPTPPGDGIYAQVVGAGDVDIVTPTVMRYIPTNSGQWRDRGFVNLRSLAVTDITAAGAKGTLKFHRDAAGKPWSMASPGPYRADNEKITRLLDELQNISVSWFVTDAPSDLESYGLQPPQLGLTFGQNTNQLFSVQFGKSPTNGPGLVFARTNSSNTILLVPGEDLKEWNDDASTFRDPYLFSQVAAEAPESVEADGANGAKQFTWQKSTMTITDGQGLSFPADPDAVSIFLQELLGIRVVNWAPNRFANDAPSDADLSALGLAPQPIRRYTLKSASNSEPAKVIAQLDFGSDNTNQPGTVCARRSDLLQEHAVFAVSLRDFNRLPTNALDFRRRAIWTFDSTNASRIRLQGNGMTTNWLHLGQFHWKPMADNYISSADQGVYLESLATYLGILRAKSWVGRGEPTPALGFSGNSLQFSVWVNQTEPLTVTIGGPVPGTANGRSFGDRYACTRMEDGQNWIFILSDKDVADLMNSIPTANN